MNAVMEPEVRPRSVVATTARWLGFCGLIPFYGALLVLLLPQPEWAPIAWRALIGYGVVILTFLGAVHWGVAISAQAVSESAAMRLLIWSVVPSLIGWSVLLLGLAPGPALLVLAAGFSAQFGADLRLNRARQAPDWFLALRGRLTIGVLVCLALAFLVAPRNL